MRLIEILFMASMFLSCISAVFYSFACGSDDINAGRKIKIKHWWPAYLFFAPFPMSFGLVVIGGCADSIVIMVAGVLVLYATLAVMLVTHVYIAIFIKQDAIWDKIIIRRIPFYFFATIAAALLSFVVQYGYIDKCSK